MRQKNIGHCRWTSEVKLGIGITYIKRYKVPILRVQIKQKLLPLVMQLKFINMVYNMLPGNCNVLNRHFIYAYSPSMYRISEINFKKSIQ